MLICVLYRDDVLLCALPRLQAQWAMDFCQGEVYGSSTRLVYEFSIAHGSIDPVPWNQYAEI